MNEEIEAIGKNFYRKRLWVVMTRPVAPMDAIVPHLPDHLRYQIALEKQGHLFAAGPLTPAAGDAVVGAGLIILRAGSEEEARKYADGDPLHRLGLRTYDLFCWDVHEGRMTISIDLSDSRFRLE